ncbi:hypothetical protein [Stygiolobus sp. CP8521M]|uniref:hypothetical protein n=1 Tax=Stygiolobus sp. CP8521M TaxID=3133136 RepID=UPI00307DDD70
MCAYQDPEVYLKRFVGRALSGIESVQFFFEERVPHIRLKTDYGVEDIVIEAKSPCGRVTDREQVKNSSYGNLREVIPRSRY